MKQIYYILISLFLVNSLYSQSEKDMAIEYYKRAKASYEEKKYDEAEKYANKCADMNIADAEEGLTHLRAQIAYNKKEYQKSYNLIDKYFELPGLKTSESKVKRYSEMVALKIDIEPILEKELKSILESKLSASSFDKSASSSITKFETDYGTAYRLGSYCYRSTQDKVGFVSNVNKSVTSSHLLLTNNELIELSDYIFKKMYPEDFKALFGTYWYNNDNEFALITINENGVSTKSKKELSTYVKNNHQYPMLVFWNSGLEFSVTNKSSKDFGLYLFNEKKYSAALYAFLEDDDVSNLSDYANIFRQFWGNQMGCCIREGVNKYFDMLRVLNQYFSDSQSHYAVLYVKKQLLAECLKWYQKNLSSGNSSIYEINYIKKQISDCEEIINKKDPNGSEASKWDLSTFDKLHSR